MTRDAERVPCTCNFPFGPHEESCSYEIALRSRPAPPDDLVQAGEGLCQSARNIAQRLRSIGERTQAALWDSHADMWDHAMRALAAPAPVAPMATDDTIIVRLREMANGLLDGAPECWNGDDARAQVLWAQDMLAAADALRPKTCSTCRWVRHLPDPGFPHEPDASVAVCCHESEAHPLHWCNQVGNPEAFGCTFHEARPRA